MRRRFDRSWWCGCGSQVVPPDNKKNSISLPVFCSPCLIVLRAPAGTGMYCTRYVLFLFFTSTKLYSNPIDASPISCCWYLVPGTLASCWELYRISLPLGIREPIRSTVWYCTVVLGCLPTGPMMQYGGVSTPCRYQVRYGPVSRSFNSYLLLATLVFSQHNYFCHVLFFLLTPMF